MFSLVDPRGSHLEYTVRPKTKVKYVGTTFKGILSIDLMTVWLFWLPSFVHVRQSTERSVASASVGFLNCIQI